MHVCIIGSGVSGLMTAFAFKDLNFIKKITVIESKKIPPVKIGESTTLAFNDYVYKHFDLKKFVTSTDATVKYGVCYDNWSSRPYLNFFYSSEWFEKHGYKRHEYGKLLSNKDPNTHVHEFLGKNLWKFSQDNLVSSNSNQHPFSWHFDAGKFKIFLKTQLKEHSKVEFVYDTIVECDQTSNKTIKSLTGEQLKYIADYYINCCGNNEVNRKVFKETYEDFSSYLLTNKAWVYPLPFKDKKKQFHPYTKAKTMKHGWRWITPTQSRVGTGYVFSDKHVSIEEARDEFISDIGDEKVKPFLVDFHPQMNTEMFKTNHCAIGMSGGFLEPLDAPGLSLSVVYIKHIESMLRYIHSNKLGVKQLENVHRNPHCVDYIQRLNSMYTNDFQFWCAFILCQYKTSWRNDTQFWKDHKNVVCPFYDFIIDNLKDPPYPEDFDYHLLHYSAAAKDMNFNLDILGKPFYIEDPVDDQPMHHLDYIQQFYSK